MADPVTTLTYQAKATFQEVLGAASVPGAATAAARTLTQSGFDTGKTLTAATTPPVTCGALFDQALTSGTATIDLTALVGANTKTVNGTGLRVQVLRLRNPATNANPISIAKGASNGYDGLGANFKDTLAPGAEFLRYLNDAGSDIGSGNKTLDLAGTGAQVLEVEIIMG